MPNSTLGSLPLRELQKWMRWMITDPRGVLPALETADHSHPRYREPLPRRLDTIESTAVEGGSREERLSVYAEAYFQRILDSLTVDFSCTRELLGEFNFARLCGDFLKNAPSHVKSIGEVGLGLPEFSETHALKESFSILPDLLRLERECLHAFFSLEPTAESRESLVKLAHLSEDEWNSVHLQLHPSMRILRSEYPLAEVWTFLSESIGGIEPRELLPAFNSVSSSVPTSVLIISFDGIVDVTRLSEFETIVFSRSLAGDALMEILQSVQEELLENVDVMALFRSWTEKDWVVGVLNKAE